MRRKCDIMSRLRGQTLGCDERVNATTEVILKVNCASKGNDNKGNKAAGWRFSADGDVALSFLTQ